MISETPGQRRDHERRHPVFAAPIRVGALGDETRDVLRVTELRVEQQIFGHRVPRRDARRGPLARSTRRADRRGRRGSVRRASIGCSRAGTDSDRG